MVSEVSGCDFLNMPPPLTENAYDGLSYSTKATFKQGVEKGTSDTTPRLRGILLNAGVGVSVDGTWQRKGFSSTLGVVTAISIDKRIVLDATVLSKSCKGCTSMKEFASSDPACYETWKLSHNCNLNYNGSFPRM